MILQECVVFPLVTHLFGRYKEVLVFGQSGKDGTSDTLFEVLESHLVSVNSAKEVKIEILH